MKSPCDIKKLRILLKDLFKVTIKDINENDISLCDIKIDKKDFLSIKKILIMITNNLCLIYNYSNIYVENKYTSVNKKVVKCESCYAITNCKTKVIKEFQKDRTYCDRCANKFLI